MLHTIFVEPLVFLLEAFHRLFAAAHFPYTYGFSIIAVTILLRLLMLPLTLKSMSSMRKMQELQPEIEKLKKKYKNDQQKLLQEQQRLYQEAGVNPLGGCLPMLVQMPILFGFYYAVRELAQSGQLVNQGFFWIPNLAFPDIGTGLSWLWPLPPSVGWDTAVRYLVLPILLAVTQIITQKLSTSSSSTDDNPQAQMMNQMMWFMSLMFLYITLTLPAALSLYWVTSNVLGIVQQLYVNRTMKAAMAPATATAAAPANPTSAESASGTTETSQKEQAAQPKETAKAKGGKKGAKRRRRKRR